MNAYFDGMRRYIDFKGRATRAQFWQFTAVFTLLMLVTAVLDAVFGLRIGLSDRMLNLVVGATHLVPFIAISVRRLHDTDRSGAWYLVNVIPLGSLFFLYLVCLPSTPGPNTYESLDDADAPGTALRTGPAMATARALAGPIFDGHWQQYTPPKQTAAPASLTPRLPMDEGARIEQLERLVNLRSADVITESEFAALKAKILPSAQS